MENTLLGVGIACVIAAIVGGGLKAFGLELPIVNSVKRQTLLGLFGLALTVAAVIPNGFTLLENEGPTDGANFIYGTWTLTKAIDNEGNNWNDSTLKFTAQEPSKDGFHLVGKFTWRQNGETIGTESVSGNYLRATRQVIFEGQAVKSMPDRPPLAVGSYSAFLSPDNRTLTEGRWGSTMDNLAGVAGKWEATR